MIHYGHGEWIIVDSCADGAGQPAALHYLKQIGVDAGRSVRMIVVTHWHDDHIRGIAQIVRNCPRAVFVCPAAFRREEFLTLVAAYAAGAMMAATTGIREIEEILALVSERGTRALLATENRLLLRRRGCQLWALSPSDESIRSALIHLAERMPRPMESKAAVPSPTPNHLAIALLVQFEGAAVLLGGDVVRLKDRTRGWLRIVDMQSEYGHPVADVVKVPHHGSSGADADEMWTRLLSDRPVAVLTPFRQGGVSLPRVSDVSRICARTTQAYITSLPHRVRVPKRTPAVDKTLVGVLRNRRMVLPPFGRITLRRALYEGGCLTIRLAGAACRLDHGMP